MTDLPGAAHFDQRAEPTMEQAAEDPSLHHPAEIDDLTGRRPLHGQGGTEPTAEPDDAVDPVPDAGEHDLSHKDSAEIAEDVTQG
ncbi:hypothetical protein [Propioniciclava sp.]|uniref:hypothetical protein n=1 Tax=Propioniciclava sp. TaxID=2038686 RepID=UPI002628A833|nr:hypothetical protein [Propioniciclava sp.]